MTFPHMSPFERKLASADLFKLCDSHRPQILFLDELRFGPRVQTQSQLPSKPWAPLLAIPVVRDHAQLCTHVFLL